MRYPPAEGGLVDHLAASSSQGLRGALLRFRRGALRQDAGSPQVVNDLRPRTVGCAHVTRLETRPDGTTRINHCENSQAGAPDTHGPGNSAGS